MIFENPYWSLETKLDLLARWIIVHSIIYYELDTSIISDQMYDNNARQFVSLYMSDRNKASKIRWYYVMSDYDGATGFHLWSRLNKKDKERLLQTAKNLVVEYGDASIVIDPRKRKKPKSPRRQ